MVLVPFPGELSIDISPLNELTLFIMFDMPIPVLFFSTSNPLPSSDMFIAIEVPSSFMETLTFFAAACLMMLFVCSCMIL